MANYNYTIPTPRQPYYFPPTQYKIRPFVPKPMRLNLMLIIYGGDYEKFVEFLLKRHPDVYHLDITFCRCIQFSSTKNDKGFSLIEKFRIMYFFEWKKKYTFECVFKFGNIEGSDRTFLDSIDFFDN